jgi:hypothetical protein
VNLLVWL